MRLLLVEIHFLQDQILRGFIILVQRKKKFAGKNFRKLKKSFFGIKNFVENPCSLSQCLEYRQPERTKHVDRAFWN